jgi:hypothetical protein
MKLIDENPYRIAGLLSNASEKELQRQKGKITMHANVGKHVVSEYDFDFLNPIDRTDNLLISKAFSQLLQFQDKLDHAIFWFVNNNAFDETAINYLKTGNDKKAIEIWEKETDNKEVTKNNITCFNNLGTIQLIKGTKKSLGDGIENKIKLIESASFASFVHLVADQALIIDKQKQIEKFTDVLVEELKHKFPMTEILKSFKRTKSSAYDYLLKKSIDSFIFKIEDKIDRTKNGIKTDRKNAFELGLDLYVESKDGISHIKDIVGEKDLKYKMIADKVAKSVMQAGIDYFKEYESVKDVNDESLLLLDYAKNMAVSNQLLDRINENIEGINYAKERELNEAIELLKEIKDTYELNKAKVTAEVMNMYVGINQRIDWTKVNQYIEQYIDWDKAVDLVIREIPVNNVHKIRLSNDEVKKKKFKSLVDFLASKLNYSQRKKIEYLHYWKVTKSIPTWVKFSGGLSILFFILSLNKPDNDLDTIIGIAIVFGIIYLIGWIKSRI